ncbi:hypothetical protein AAHC03_024365 [Spirometra sp. Aus1]
MNTKQFPLRFFSSFLLTVSVLVDGTNFADSEEFKNLVLSNADCNMLRWSDLCLSRFARPNTWFRRGCHRCQCVPGLPGALKCRYIRRCRRVPRLQCHILKINLNWRERI